MFFFLESARMLRLNRDLATRHAGYVEGVRNVLAGSTRKSYGTLSFLGCCKFADSVTDVLAERRRPPLFPTRAGSFFSTTRYLSRGRKSGAAVAGTFQNTKMR